MSRRVFIFLLTGAALLVSAPSVFAASSLSVGAGTSAGASRAACSGSGTQPPHVGSRDFLSGVATSSACNAWAVGYYFARGVTTTTLVEHWNGTAWKVQPSPNPGGSSRLLGVAATSGNNAWAVGLRPSGALIEHWNGRAWKVQPSPNPGLSSGLTGVAATSATNAWAVGYYSSAAVVEHWNGKAWKIQTSPCPAGAQQCQLSGVAATSATNAWAVGSYESSGGDMLMLVERWNGHAWKVQPSPNPAGDNGGGLSAVAATSATNAWAVGSYQQLGVSAGLTFIERWNGQAWKIQPSPNPGGAPGSELWGVAATSATNAWAVGDTNFTNGADKTLIERWNGQAWKVQPSPNPGSQSSALGGVAATSARNVWAVGSDHNPGAASRNLALRWNGNSWGG